MAEQAKSRSADIASSCHQLLEAGYKTVFYLRNGKLRLASQCTPRVCTWRASLNKTKQTESVAKPRAGMRRASQILARGSYICNY